MPPESVSVLTELALARLAPPAPNGVPPVMAAVMPPGSFSELVIVSGPARFTLPRPAETSAVPTVAAGHVDHGVAGNGGRGERRRAANVGRAAGERGRGNGVGVVVVQRHRAAGDIQRPGLEGTVAVDVQHAGTADVHGAGGRRTPQVTVAVPPMPNVVVCRFPPLATFSTPLALIVVAVAGRCR